MDRLIESIALWEATEDEALDEDMEKLLNAVETNKELLAEKEDLLRQLAFLAQASNAKENIITGKIDSYGHEEAVLKTVPGQQHPHQEEHQAMDTDEHQLGTNEILNCVSSSVSRSSVLPSNSAEDDHGIVSLHMVNGLQNITVLELMDIYEHS